MNVILPSLLLFRFSLHKKRFSYTTHKKDGVENIVLIVEAPFLFPLFDRSAEIRIHIMYLKLLALFPVLVPRYRALFSLLLCGAKIGHNPNSRFRMLIAASALVHMYLHPQACVDKFLA